MKYLIPIPSGFELREDSLTELPQDAVALTDEQCEQLRAGTLAYQDGAFVPATPEG